MDTENRTVEEARDFTAFIVETQCPYAVRSSLKILNPGRGELGSHHWPWVVARLGEYCDDLNSGTGGHKDGVVVPLPDEDEPTIDRLVHHMRSLVHSVALADDREIEWPQIGTPPWQFAFRQIQFFVITLSPVYPDSHPRRISGRTSYFVLQPQSSFQEHLPRELYGAESRDRIKARIRAAFTRGGKPYNGTDERPRIEAARYISALNAAEPGLEWWR